MAQTREFKGRPGSPSPSLLPSYLDLLRTREDLHEKSENNCQASEPNANLLRGIYIDLTYTVGKALSIFLESVYFGFLGNLFGLLEHRRQNLTKLM